MESEHHWTSMFATVGKKVNEVWIRDVYHVDSHLQVASRDEYDAKDGSFNHKKGKQIFKKQFGANNQAIIEEDASSESPVSKKSSQWEEQ